MPFFYGGWRRTKKNLSYNFILTWRVYTSCMTVILPSFCFFFESFFYFFPDFVKFNFLLLLSFFRCCCNIFPSSINFRVYTEIQFSLIFFDCASPFRWIFLLLFSRFMIRQNDMKSARKKKVKIYKMVLPFGWIAVASHQSSYDTCRFTVLCHFLCWNFNSTSLSLWQFCLIKRDYVIL